MRGFKQVLSHSIEGDGNMRSPLDGVGGRLTEREIRLWIVGPPEMNPVVAKRAYQLSARRRTVTNEHAPVIHRSDRNRFRATMRSSGCRQPIRAVDSGEVWSESVTEAESSVTMTRQR